MTYSQTDRASSLESGWQGRKLPWRFHLCIRAQRGLGNRPMLWEKDHGQLRESVREVGGDEKHQVRGFTEAGAARTDGTLGALTTKFEKNIQTLAANRDASAPWEELWWWLMQNKAKSMSCSLKAERLTPTLFWGERRKWKYKEKYIFFFFFSILREHYRTPLKSPPELLFCLHGPTPCFGLI